MDQHTHSKEYRLRGVRDRLKKYRTPALALTRVILNRSVHGVIPANAEIEAHATSKLSCSAAPSVGLC